MGTRCYSCDCVLDEVGMCPMCKAYAENIMNEFDLEPTLIEEEDCSQEEDWRGILDNINEQPTIQERLREGFPYGHERFIELSLDEMSLHSQKNYDYAHGGDPLGNFVRVANILSNYPGLKLTPAVVALVYAMKQLDAVLWQLSQGYEGTVERIDDKAQDIHVYVKLFRILLEEA